MQVLSSKFCKFFQSTFIYGTRLVAASVLKNKVANSNPHLLCFINLCLLINKRLVIYLPPSVDSYLPFEINKIVSINKKDFWN